MTSRPNDLTPYQSTGKCLQLLNGVVCNKKFCDIHALPNFIKFRFSTLVN
jgi:hypothetical protein